MGCFQVVTGRSTNPSTLTAWTMNGSDSATVKSFNFGDQAQIIGAWGQQATAGILRVRSPRLHDVNQGLRYRVAASTIRNLIPPGFGTGLYPQDVLTLEMQGGGAETDVQSLLLYYANLPGNAQRLITRDEVKSRQLYLAGMEVATTTSATAGQYGSSVALNATFDNWKRGYDYAILGYEVDVAAAGIVLTGPDLAQVQVGGPAPAEPLETRNWFAWLDQELGVPSIPVISAVNIGATSIAVYGTATSAAVNVTLHVAQLSTAGSPS